MKREMHAGFWWGKLRGRDHFEDPRAGSIPLKCISKTGQNGWLRARNRGQLLWTRLRTFGFTRSATISFSAKFLLREASVKQSLEYKGTKFLQNVNSTSRHTPADLNPQLMTGNWVGPKPEWTLWRQQKSLAVPGIEPRFLRRPH